MPDNPFLPFLPYNLASALLQNAEMEPIGYEQRFKAVALFADISGFTAMSEALGKQGKFGTEELNTLLNRYFSDMIDLVEKYGGIVAKFGGDALTVIFPCRNQTKTVTRRAIACALDMQAQMYKYQNLPTSGGLFSLAVKAGISIGWVFCTTVGQLTTRFEPVIAGSLLDRCAEAEHHAHSGEIVLDNRLLAYAGQLETEPINESFCKVFKIKRLPPLTPLTKLESVPNRFLKAFLHPAIAYRLESGQAGFVNEHRKVTVIFARFSDFDYDHDRQVGSKLQTYFRSVIQIIQKYDGHLRQIDMGDKGSKFIVLFGAPVAHENEEERAMRCALELRDFTRALGLNIQIGINSGLVFCGLVGSARRMEYSAIGDSVNLSARLMQTAQANQILTTSSTTKAFPTAFGRTEQSPVRFKGKSEPITPFSIEQLMPTNQPRHVPGYLMPIVGRATELNQAEKLLTEVMGGQGRILGICGEAGIGKSRVVNEINRQATAMNMTVFSGECISYDSGAGYRVWQGILNEVFELKAAVEPELRLKNLAEHLSALGETFLEKLPLLGTPLQLAIPDNALTASLDPKIRKVALEAVIVDYLVERARQKPLVLILEDCHWLDELSRDLLLALAPRLSQVPVLLLLVYRPLEGRALLPPLSYSTEINLPGFTPENALLLVKLKLKQLYNLTEADFTPSSTLAKLMQKVIEQAQGNPFYLDELINLLNDRQLDPRQANTLQKIDLPESLQSLILSRIDRLAEAEKATLKVASVIGRIFKAGWLWEACPELGVSTLIKNQLETLDRLDITPLNKPEPELEYQFRHILTRDVVYESMAYATRARLHEQIGFYIENRYKPSESLYLDELAYHWGQTENREKQCRYFYEAAEASRAAYANEAAIHYYSRLLPLLPETAQFAVLIKLGQVTELVGQIKEALAYYKQARQLAETYNNRVEIAEALYYTAGVFRSSSELEQSASLHQQGIKLCQENEDNLGLARHLSGLGLVFFNKSDYGEALAYFQQSLALLEPTDEKKALSNTLNNIGLVYWNTGKFPEAIQVYNRSLDLSRHLKDRPGIARALNNLGLINNALGQYREALDCYLESYRITEEVGDRRTMGLSLNNIGIVYGILGEYKEALKIYVQAQEISDSLLEFKLHRYILSNLGLVYKHLGRYSEAQQVLEQAYEVCKGVEDRRLAAYSLTNLGENFLLLSQYQAALSNFQCALEIAELIGAKEVMAQALSGVAIASYLTGDRLTAENFYYQAYRLSEELQLKSLALLCQSWLVRLNLEKGAEHESQASLAEVLQKMGGVDLEAAVKAQFNFNIYTALKVFGQAGYKAYLQKAGEAIRKESIDIEDEQTRREFLAENWLSSQIKKALHLERLNFRLA